MSKKHNTGKKVLVSACLYGHCTRYDAKSNLLRDEIFLDWKNQGKLIPVCPEVLGGLRIPRSPAEICDGKVINKDGEDVTDKFVAGANEVLKIAKENNITVAVMKDGSPSCGCNLIYDGSFSGKKIKGAGICARLLIENGIVVMSENDVAIAKVLLNDNNHTHHGGIK